MNVGDTISYLYRLRANIPMDAWLILDDVFHDCPAPSAPPPLSLRPMSAPPTGHYVWPVTGYRISDRFGPRAKHPITGRPAFHHGLDLAVPMGTEVRAVDAGTVVFAGVSGRIGTPGVPKSGQGYGRLIKIDHGGGRRSAYGHLDAFLVKAGDTVTQGQAIARSGSSGGSTGPHLHFALWVGGEAVDPLKYLG